MRGAGRVQTSLQEDLGQSGAGSLVRGLGILEALVAAEPNGLGHAALARRLGLQRSTLYRYLGMLLELGYIEKGREDHRYRLGPRCVVLGAAALRERDFPRLAKSYVAELAQATGRTAHATIFDDNHAVTVELAAGNARIGSCIAVGSRRPANRSASGRVFLAHSREALTRVWPQASSQPTGPAIDPALFDGIRRQRFALDQGEFISGVSCIASPVFGRKREVVGALSISMAADALTPEDIHKLNAPLVAIAGRFTEQIAKSG